MADARLRDAALEGGALREPAPLPAATAAVPAFRGPHVAIVMDGNGRWAKGRGLPRCAGHRRGARVARQIVEAAGEMGVGVLTLFAFSSDNWRRPLGEVRRVLALIRWFLRDEARKSAERGVRLAVIGRRDRLPASLVRSIDDAERRTAACSTMLLRVAVDYSARDAIVAAADGLRRAPAESVALAPAVARDEMPAGLSSSDGSRDRLDRAAFGRSLAAAVGGPVVPDVDLFLRPGGERRLSDFLLFESAYAELVFLDRLWPDVTRDDLASALADFRSRERRFGSAAAS